MKRNIRKILKEETNLQSKILNLIASKGLIRACQITGGIEIISKILQETPEKLLTKYLSQETFSTDDINKNTGGYDFKFKLQYVKKSHYYTGEYDFYYLVEEGTVNLMGDYDESLWDLLGDDIREFDMWWEIKHEIRDVLYDFTEELIEKLKLDFGSASVNYLFKGRDQFNYINEEKLDTTKKLEDSVTRAIKNFTKGVDFPENFLKFDVYVKSNKHYNETDLIITTIMKKEFGEDDLDKIYDIRYEFIPKIKALFKGNFDHIYYNSTTTLDMFNQEKEKREKFGMF